MERIELKMKQDFESMGKQLLSDPRAEQLKKLADSPDGKKITAMLDQGEVERAAKSGDTAALQKILTQVLSTGEGKRLAEQLSKTMGSK